MGRGSGCRCLPGMLPAAPCRGRGGGVPAAARPLCCAHLRGARRWGAQPSPGDTSLRQTPTNPGRSHPKTEPTSAQPRAGYPQPASGASRSRMAGGGWAPPPGCRRRRRRRKEPPYSFGGNSPSPSVHWLREGVGRGCRSLCKRRRGMEGGSRVGMLPLVLTGSPSPEEDAGLFGGVCSRSHARLATSSSSSTWQEYGSSQRLLRSAGGGEGQGCSQPAHTLMGRPGPASPAPWGFLSPGPPRTLGTDRRLEERGDAARLRGRGGRDGRQAQGGLRALPGSQGALAKWRMLGCTSCNDQALATWPSCIFPPLPLLQA